MPKDFRIKVDSPSQGAYFPGMSVSGTVVCTTDKPKSYKQIVITLVGRGQVQWSKETSSAGENNNEETIETFSSSEEYVSCSAVLWDKTENGQGGSFPVGSHHFNFSLQLAGIGNNKGNMPASYADAVGTITYTLEAVIVKPSPKQDKKVVTTVNVENEVKIDGPELSSPLSMEVHKTLCCLCCASGPIVITARIPRTGFCVGYDSIPVEITVENGSDREIEHFQISLTKKVVYTAQGRRHHDSKTLHTVTTRAVAPNETTVIQPDPIAIPSDTPPTQNSSWILTINYFVIVTASLPVALSPYIDMPIVIGNVPVGGF